MRQTIKSLAHKIAPTAAERFFSRRIRRHNERVIRQSGLPRVNQLVADHSGGVVMTGPFAGMRYQDSASGSTTAPKLVGSYESELHPWIETLLSQSFDLIIDVGCAEGYYAVGMARHFPQGNVIAFDIDPVARARCIALAKLNQVEARIDVRTRCSPEALSQAITGKTLVISDVEGYEGELLDLARCPNLVHTTVLVELHEKRSPNVTALLKERFESTHSWAEVESTDRRAENYPAVAFLPEADRDLALTEMRNGPQSWALLTPNSTAD